MEPNGSNAAKLAVGSDSNGSKDYLKSAGNILSRQTVVRRVVQGGRGAVVDVRDVPGPPLSRPRAQLSTE